VLGPIDDPTRSGRDVADGGPFRSRFGGLWLDREDAPRLLRERLADGRLDDVRARQLSTFAEKGALVLPGAIPPPLVERILHDVNRAWSGRDPNLFVEHFDGATKRFSPAAPHLRGKPAKLLDLHAVSEAVREAIFAPALVTFLRALFERPPLAFQSLSFETGTEQPMHQDTAFVRVRPAMEFVGSWIALEDIDPRSGPFEYYEGSHRFDDFPFPGGDKHMPPDWAGEQSYLAWLHDQAARRGLTRTAHHPRKGDVIVWHADLAHGGSLRRDPTATRRSLVTHYCPIDAEPAYHGYAPHSGRRRHPSGAAYSFPLRGPQPLWRRSSRALRTLGDRAARWLGLPGRAPAR